MKPINPDVVSYLITQDREAIKRMATALVKEAFEIGDRASSGSLSVHHLQSAQASLTDLTYRLTRLGALNDVLPKS